ncbi:unnamed protein product, partial [Rotaria sp. Silwood1]
TFYHIYDNECYGNDNLFTTKICVYFDVRPIKHNEAVIAEKIHYYVVKNKAKFYDVWKKCNKLQKEQKFANIVALTQEEFRPLPVSESSTNFKKLRRSSTSASSDPSPTTSFYSPPTPTSISPLPNLTKRQRDFSEVSSRQKRRRLCDLNSFLDEFAQANDLTINQVIGYLLYQRNYNSDKYLANLGHQLYENEYTNNSYLKSVDLDEALALKCHLNLSRTDMDFLKWFTNDYVIIPNRQYIKNHTDDLIPSLTSCRNDRGIYVKDRREPMQLTIQRLIDALHSKNINVPSHLSYREKTGQDGAGSMSIYRSSENPMSDPNIFSKMFVPLTLKDEKLDQVLWQNESPNSAFYARPLLLIAERENDDLLRFVNEEYENQEKSLEKYGLTFKYKSKTYVVKITIEASMKDMKVRMAESGLGGAQCLMCSTTQEDWKNSKKILDSNFFNINRTAEKTLTLYNQLADNDGNILKRKNDYDTRTGLTSKPLSINDQHFITITHQYINGTSWILKIMSHMRANVLAWAIHGKDKQDQISKEKKAILKIIQGKTGLRLDQCDSSSSTTGGTSTTGGQGRKFFSHEVRDILVSCVPSRHRTTLRKLIQLYSIILRAVSSTQSINIVRFNVLIMDFKKLLCNEKWINYTMTVHSLIFHSCELIQRNHGVALGELSEEALESCNKDIRNFREFLSRKCGHIMNLTDVFNRLFIRSDPIIRKVVIDTFNRRQVHSKTSTATSQSSDIDDQILSTLFL